MSLTTLMKKYENGGTTFQKNWWFKLVDDGDSALVRLLVKGVIGENNGEAIYDLDVYEVHKVEIDGFLKSVKCLGGDDCPLCRSGNKPQLRIWIPMLNHDETDADKKVQLWERGITEIKTLLGEIEENGDLNTGDYKIKRNGKKNSTKTTYQFFRKRDEDISLPDKPVVLGRFVLELDANDMNKVLNGTFTLQRDSDGTVSNQVASNGDDTDVF